MLRTLAFLLGAGTVCACADTFPTESAAAPADGLSAISATHTDDLFFATADCTADIGFPIRFGGPRTVVEHSTATTRTTSFGTQDFQGWLRTDVNAANYQSIPADYEVLGGAEMFNRKPDENGVLQVRIHRGTLVFSSLTDGTKIVARHIITAVPGREETINTWECRIVGQS